MWVSLGSKLELWNHQPLVRMYGGCRDFWAWGWDRVGGGLKVEIREGKALRVWERNPLRHWRRLGWEEVEALQNGTERETTPYHNIPFERELICKVWRRGELESLEMWRGNLSEDNYKTIIITTRYRIVIIIKNERYREDSRVTWHTD